MHSRPRRTRPSHRRTWPQRLLLALGAFLTISCLASASAVGYVYLRFGDLKHLDLTVRHAAVGEAQNYLVVGSDSRSAVDPASPEGDGLLNGDAESGYRTDTIMIVRVDPKAETIALLSFPRDLWIPISGTGGSQRINTAYAKSQQTLIDTIEQDFGVPINHYIEVNFAGFKDLVDAIGGVPLYFDTPVRDTNTGLSIATPGCVNLTGDQALRFARSRHLQWKTSTGWHSDPTADLGRITRQQIFIQKALGKVFQTSALDLPRVYKLIDAADKSVTTDTGLGVDDLHNLADQFKKFNPDNNLYTITLPVENFTTSGGAAVVRLLTDKAQPILNFFSGKPAGESAVTVKVLNGTGAVGQATAVAAALSQVGFQISTTANAPNHVARTEVHYAPGAEAGADLLARHLTNGALLVEEPTAGAGSVVLVIGPDFTTVMDTPYASSSSATTSTNTDATSSTDSTPSTALSSTTSTAPTTSVPTTAPDSTTSTTVAPPPTLAAVGHATGIPPPGVTC